MTTTGRSAGHRLLGNRPQPDPSVSVTRRADVQGLRALAVLLVVAFHAGLPVPGGFLGVDVFFVISGYVIISMIHRELATTGRLSLRNFFTRRIRRIMPALALLTTVTVAAAWYWLSPLGTQQITATTARAASLLYANWSIRATSGDYFDEAAEVNPLLHTWSLSVEEQFYLVFPALMAAVWAAGRRTGRSRQAATGMLIGLAVGTGVAALALTSTWGSQFPDSASLAFYGSVFRVWEFAVGGLIAVVVVGPPSVGRIGRRVIGLMGMVAVLGAAFAVDGSTPWPGPWTLVPVLGTAAVILAGVGTERGVVPGLASRPAVFVGDLSYSWYLWHWPMIVFAAVLVPSGQGVALLAAAASIVPAWLSFRLLEEPIRHSGIRGRRVVGLAAVCVIVPVAAAAWLTSQAEQAVAQAHATQGADSWVLGERTHPAPPDDELAAAILAQQGQWEVYGEPCLGGGQDEPVGSCTFFDDNPGPSVLLVGDSHAGAHAPAFLAAAAELGLRAEVVTSTACPFVDAVIAFDEVPADDCTARNVQIWRHLERTQFDVVVVANRSPAYISPTIELADERNTSRAMPCVWDELDAECLDHQAAVTAWGRAMGETLSRLRDSGSAGVLLQTVPEHEAGLEDCVTGSTVDHACLETPRSTSWERRVGVIESETQAAEAAAATVYDPFETYCPGATCSQFLGGEFRYRNDDHVNPAGSLMLTDRFVELLQRAP